MWLIVAVHGPFVQLLLCWVFGAEQVTAIGAVIGFGIVGGSDQHGYG
jgi:hypothetical protein